MKNEFLGLWESVGAKGNALETYDYLIKRYSEPHRFYHNQSHIKQCLAEAKQVRYLVKNYPALKMAIWFHDIIYDPRGQNNEEKSAALAFITLTGAFLNNNFAERVMNLVLATKHVILPTDNDEKFIVDIDLSSFGLPEEKFNENTQLIRQEYDWVPTEIFARERTKILKAFQARPTVFLTPFFQQKYEKTAQANLKHSIAQLSALF
jgi:predicted metal-dependent HD superfamily phosphohydrolase